MATVWRPEQQLPSRQLLPTLMVMRLLMFGKGGMRKRRPYPLGKNTVRVKAVDSTGAESSWAAIIFFVMTRTVAAA